MRLREYTSCLDIKNTDFKHVSNISEELKIKLYNLNLNTYLKILENLKIKPYSLDIFSNKLNKSIIFTNNLKNPDKLILFRYAEKLQTLKLDLIGYSNSKDFMIALDDFLVRSLCSIVIEIPINFEGGIKFADYMKFEEIKDKNNLENYLDEFHINYSRINDDGTYKTDKNFLQKMYIRNALIPRKITPTR